MCYMCYNGVMKTAGVREARQNLTTLIDEAKKGREVLITERGRPVARLVPPVRKSAFPDLAAFRRRSPRLVPPLSQTLLEHREDRI
jgi:prevent-host-death family protein